MKKYLFLLILPMLFLVPKDTFAATIGLGTPTYYQHYISPETTISGSATLMGWWGTSNYYYSGAYLGNPGSTGNISDRVNYIWPNSNLCAGQNITIKGTIGGLTGFFTNVANHVNIYNNGEKLSCTFAIEQNGSRLSYSCAGKGGGNLDIYIFEDSFISGGLYEVGVSREVDVTCDNSNTDIIIADKENTNAIINNQNSNHEKAEETRKGIWNTIKELPSMFLDMLKSLFIPSDDFFEDFINEFKETFMDKLGFLIFPFEVIITLLDRYVNLDANPIINIPTIKEPFNDFVLIEARTFNIQEIFETGAICTLYNIYMVFTGAFMIVLFLNYCIKKFNEFVKGRGDGY